MQSPPVLKVSVLKVSVLAEAIRNNETIHSARERVSSAAHVMTHYRAIALPALAAAAQRVAKTRQHRRASAMPSGDTIALES